MSVERIESFGIYANANGSNNPTVQAANAASLLRRCQFCSLATTTNVNPRTPGGNSLSLQQGAGWTISVTPRTSWVVGFGLNYGGALSSAGTTLYQNLAMSLDGLTQAAFLRVVLNTTGTLSLYARSTLIATSTYTISANSWVYVEIDMSYAVNGGGTIQTTADIYINGTLIVSGNADTGLNPAQFLFGNCLANIHTWGSPSLGLSVNTLISDLYIINQVPMTPNQTRLGPIKTGVVFPASDSLTQWTPSAAGTHFSLVNENPEDGDTTYVASSTAAQEDDYTYQTVTTGLGTLKAVQISTCHRKTDNGTKVFYPTISSAPANPNIYCHGNYQYDIEVFDENPAAAAPWTPTNFNSEQFGMELVS